MPMQLKHILSGIMFFTYITCVFLFTACHSNENDVVVDDLNQQSYSLHYRDLGRSLFYANRAYRLSTHYGDGKAEAMNNIAFVQIARMEYGKAFALLEKIPDFTDNQVELLVADVQMMRLCQRQSDNKEFYNYRQRAQLRINRIDNDIECLNEHQKKRFVYAKSEYYIILSTYFYYVGLENQSRKAMENIDPYRGIASDTAQLLNYYYNIGSGGFINDGSKRNVKEAEFEYLIRCYLLSKQFGFVYWEANSMQALSEHLQNPEDFKEIRYKYPQEISFINKDNMADSLLAGNLAQRSLLLFEKYGDVYQTAGAYRTLAECYWLIGDYRSAILCLNNALAKNKLVEDAPDLVASIRERLSMAYSAIGDKAKSDYNRNIYLDMQDMTRQDRELEARADQLYKSSYRSNVMISVVILTIILVVSLIFVFDYLRRKSCQVGSIEDMLKPLSVWKRECEDNEKASEELHESICEEINVARTQALSYKKKGVEQRAKVSLVISILPLINRMVNEVRRISVLPENSPGRLEKYEYVSEITKTICDYNKSLTKWIDLRRGDLSLHIESFRLQELFDILKRSYMEYKMKGLDFEVVPTDAVVKADRVMTLFMINTMAENARRYTPSGGKISISGLDAGTYVEISIKDNGFGIEECLLSRIFCNKMVITNHERYASVSTAFPRNSQHGFGLMNCKGIIEKYKKMSSIFNVCTISAESKIGEGSRFYFRLPKGISKLGVLFVFSLNCFLAHSSQVNTKADCLYWAGTYADSAYFSNVNGQYRRTISYADSCIKYLNAHYMNLRPKGKDFMVASSRNDGEVAELKWFYENLKTDYSIILDIRNESAVADLALHKWDDYYYNNKVYTQLFRECSADNSLPEYVRVMQKSENNKNVTIIILIFLLMLIFPSYYFLYYRHRIYYKLCLEKINGINNILLDKTSASIKLEEINNVWQQHNKFIDGEENMESLKNIVGRIKISLEKNIEATKRQEQGIGYAREELRKIEMERDNVYVCNNVLDNCLSTLKHETMYYPSRIMQLIDGTDLNLTEIKELSLYYDELYSILCEQAMKQVEHSQFIDYEMVAYLFELLAKLNDDVRPNVEVCTIDKDYVKLTVRMMHLKLPEGDVSNLFTPLTCDFRFLVCKQIVREVGDWTNLRGCGILAKAGNEGTIIILIFSQYIWNHLKS